MQSITIDKFSRRGYDHRGSVILLSPIRDYIEKKLGELDTALSFMYLFRRFGTPAETNKNDYKILYSYKLRFNDINYSIHASYNEFVYFSLRIPNKYCKEIIKEYLKEESEFIANVLYNNIPYVPDLYGFTEECGMNQIQYTKNLKLISNLLAKYLSEEENKLLVDACNDGYYYSNYDKSEIKPLYEKANQYLHNKFVDFLGKREYNKFKKKMGEYRYLSFYPELKKQIDALIRDLKKGVWVRDVAFNIKGYESKENKITRFVKD